ncbi:MAG: hypothetical protein J5950_05595 [Clostridia bacterium]|nr:hypothetical protein [Clostridia bacterium]
MNALFKNIRSKKTMTSAAAIFALITATVLALALTATDVMAAGTEVQLPEFVIANDSAPAEGTAYTDTEVRTLSASEAEKIAPATAGASGNVLMLTGGSEGAGVLLDYSAYKISCYGIRSITVRACVPDSVKALGLSIDGGETVIGRYSPAGYEKNRWTDFAFYDEGINFVSGHDMPDLSDENGRLGTLSLNFVRNTKDSEDGSTQEPIEVFIDSVIIRIKDASGSPKLEYVGQDNIDQTAGKPLEIGEATAYDSVEERELTVNTRWDGARGIDDDGNAIEGGPYTLVFETENSFGEKDEKRVTITVRPRDTEPPVILISTESISVRTGTYGSMVISATDNEDDVEVVNVWSKNALDKSGRLLPGEHELTLFCSDNTGNITEKKIKVTVEDEPENDPESLPVTRDESKINFGLPVWALILIIAALVIVAAAVCLLILRKIKAKKKNAQ